MTLSDLKKSFQKLETCSGLYVKNINISKTQYRYMSPTECNWLIVPTIMARVFYRVTIKYNLLVYR